MNEIEQFTTLLNQKAKQGKTPQLRWAVCHEVNWNSKTMTAIGQTDELEYYNVSLGAGSLLIKPAVGALCLLGIIEGEESATVLLSASEIEEAQLISSKGNIHITNGETSLYNVYQSLVKLITNIKVLTPSGVSVGLHPETIKNLNDFETLFKQLLKDA